MQRTLEQRYAIKFCLKLGKSASDTLQLINDAYGDEAISRAQVFRWYKAFAMGRKNAEDAGRCGRPSTSRNDENIKRIKKAIDGDNRLGVRLIAEINGLSRSDVYRIVKEDLDLQRIFANYVPLELTDEQKVSRVEISSELLDSTINDSGFINRVIVGDEMWIYKCDAEAKDDEDSDSPKEYPRPKAKQCEIKVKTKIIVFFTSKGIVHKEFVPESVIVDTAFYKQVLDRLREQILRVRPDIAESSILYHSRNSLVIREFLASRNMTTLPRPPYSPDLIPADFFLFSRIDGDIRPKRFASIAELQAEVNRFLERIPEKEFAECFDQWQMRWKLCIAANGSYFEDSWRRCVNATRGS